MGYVTNPYDECIMTLPQQTSGGVLHPGKPLNKDSRSPRLNEGIMLIEVDGILEGGTDVHRKRMEDFYEKWKFGKKKSLRECGTEGSMISGIHVAQHKDYSFTWHMQRYADEKWTLTETLRGCLPNTN